MIIWQHVRKCLIEWYKLDKTAEGIQGGKITGDGLNQQRHHLGINLKLDHKRSVKIWISRGEKGL